MSSSPQDHRVATNASQPPKRNSASVDHQTSSVPRKRRARYVWRACDVCRRRKGRCDGRKPCDFCHSRALDCCYTSDSDTGGPSAPADEGATAASSLTTASLAPNDSVSRLVLALQAQLDTLAAHVESCTNAPGSQDATTEPVLAQQTTSLDALLSTIPAQSSAILPSALVPVSNTAAYVIATGSSKNATRRFCGPTSPDYSLNAAEIKLRQTQTFPNGETVAQETNPSLEDDHSDDGQTDHFHEGTGPGTQASATAARLRQCVGQLPRFLSRHETLRLLNVYQDVIGNLHPILEMTRLVQQAEACYAENRGNFVETCNAQDNTVLILFLVLVIALTAESVSQSSVGKTLYKSVEHLIKIKLASEVSSLDHILIALLAAIYHFFNDEIRLAWRVCGISGRMAMELGLHRRDVHQQLSRDEKQHAQISTLLWSIVILDRQWSAATGLPQNFQDADFDQAMEPIDNATYLKAMISYTLMSPKFERPIYHVTSGSSYEQEDAFEVLNLQIDQWLRKAIEGQSIFHPSPGEAIGVKPVTDHAKRPSSTATLLYLRANAFRSIILRPFFLSKFPSHISVKMVKPSMRVISDSISVLSLLDSTTSIYRAQHPFFQHFLNSSCALLYLVIAYARVDRNRAHNMQSTEFREPFPCSVKREVERALALASAYSNMSQRSNRLTKRLRHLEEQLRRPDFLQPSNALPMERNQSQKPTRSLPERSNSINNGSDAAWGAADIFQAMDESIGEEALDVTWWNDPDMLWPDWPNNEVMGHWA